jgi:putative variant cofactor biosynthesis B12-binding/radical SAM domain protein 1
MKVLLIQSHLEKDDLKIYPLGLVYLASCTNGHEVRICDLNLYEEPYARLEEELLKYSPDVVGISLRNIDNQDRINPDYYYEDFTEAVKRIKAVKPEVPLIVGGLGFSVFAREIMERNVELDFGVYLEGEETFAELLDRLDNPETVKGLYYRENGQIKFSGRRRPFNLDNLPPIQRSYADMSAYPSLVTTIGLESKRGCAFDCIYCNYPLLSGKKIRLRKPEAVVDEIEEMVSAHGINTFIFVDPVFNVPLDHASEICREIIKRNLKVKWGGYMDMRYAPEDFLFLARDAGCTDFIFSPDGMSNNALESLHKGITEDEIKKIYRLFKTSERLKDAFVIFDLLLNAPGENLRGLLKTLWFYVWANCSLRGRGRVTVNWIRIEPGTQIHKLSLANGQLSPDVSLLPETSEGLRETFYVYPPLKKLDIAVFRFVKIVKLLNKALTILFKSLKYRCVCRNQLKDSERQNRSLSVMRRRKK